MANGYPMAVDNEGMYALAQDTESYRERGIGHEEQLAKITDKLKEFTVEIDVLQSVRISDPETRRKLRKYCQQQMTIKRSVRRNPNNVLIDPNTP